MNLNDVRAALIESSYFKESHLKDATPEDLVSFYVANIDQQNPDCVDSLRADVEWAEKLLADTLATQGHLRYEGYASILCKSVTNFLWECYTHFLGEGLDEQGVEKEVAFMRDLYVQAGYIKEGELATNV